MMKIGDFSRLSHISIRMLRYYDENDILKPIYIDDINGYRYYDARQIYIGTEINFYREIGFSTDQIRLLLDSDNVAAKELILRTKQEELASLHTKVLGDIARLEKSIHILNKENIMTNYKIEVKEIPALHVVSLRDTIPTYYDEGMLWGRLCTALQSMQKNLQSNNLEKGRSYYYDTSYREKDVDVEVAIPVMSECQEIEGIKFQTYPAKTCACVTFQGSYEQIAEISMVIAAWIDKHEYTLDGPNFCIYHVPCGPNVRECDLVSEICFPIRK